MKEKKKKQQMFKIRMIELLTFSFHILRYSFVLLSFAEENEILIILINNNSNNIKKTKKRMQIVVCFNILLIFVFIVPRFIVHEKK